MILKKKHSLLFLIALLLPNIVNAKCNFTNSHLVSQSGNEYPILSIRACLGLESKSEMTNLSNGCLTYQEAEKLAKRRRSATITGTSIVEILYKGESIYLSRWESINSSPSLAFNISRELDNDDKKAKIVCKLPYPKCEYWFDASSSTFAADLPPDYEKMVKADKSNRDSIVEQYYGKIVSETLVNKNCPKRN